MASDIHALANRPLNNPSHWILYYRYTKRKRYWDINHLFFPTNYFHYVSSDEF